VKPKVEIVHQAVARIVIVPLALVADAQLFITEARSPYSRGSPL
jgi:hypothetical protein